MLYALFSLSFYRHYSQRSREILQQPSCSQPPAERSFRNCSLLCTMSNAHFTYSENCFMNKALFCQKCNIVSVIDNCDTWYILHCHNYRVGYLIILTFQATCNNIFLHKMQVNLRVGEELSASQDGVCYLDEGPLVQIFLLVIRFGLPVSFHHCSVLIHLLLKVYISVR